MDLNFQFSFIGSVERILSAFSFFGIVFSLLLFQPLLRVQEQKSCVMFKVTLRAIAVGVKLAPDDMANVHQRK